MKRAVIFCALPLLLAACWPAAVDAGKPYAELPGSGGAVDLDLGCNNAGVGVTHPFDGSRVEGRYRVTDTMTASRGDPFTWHHPDAAESTPPGRYHCNHNDMGPHGHQGLITVTVTAERYTCTAHYLGTNTGDGDNRAQRPEGVPTCRASG